MCRDPGQAGAVLPYEIWSCPDGAEVLFNRRYEPLWRRAPGQVATPADRGERIPFEREEWFYAGHTPEAECRLAGETALHAWGINR